MVIITSISVKNVNSAPDASGTFKAGSLYENIVYSIAHQLKVSLQLMARAPNYATSSLGNISFSAVDLHVLSTVLAYYLTHGTCQTMCQCTIVD